MSACEPLKPGTLPVLSMVRTVLFPGMRCAILLATDRARAALQASVAHKHPSTVAVFATRESAALDPEPADLYEVGAAARVMRLSRRRCCGRWVAELEGLGRVRSLDYVRADPFREAQCEPVPDPSEDPSLLVALAAAIRNAAIQVHESLPHCQHVRRALASAEGARGPEDFPGAVYDLLLHLGVSERQRLLEMEPLSVRLEATLREIYAHHMLPDTSTRRGGREALLH